MTRSKSRFHRNSNQKNIRYTSTTGTEEVKLTKEQKAQDEADAKKFYIILACIVVLILIIIYFLFYKNF